MIKTTLKLIKLTLKRFLSIVAIVLIGVAFMFGLLSTTNVMRKSVDAYNKETNLHDIQIFSNYGFCDDDIKSIKELDYVDEVFASKQLDVFCKQGSDNVFVARIRELNSSINKFKLVEGRMPISKNEVLTIHNKNGLYNLGDEVQVYLDDEDDLNESLEISKFKIVGFVESSEYMSKILSTSNLKNLELDSVFYVDNSVFIGDYYTCLYLTITNSDNFESGSDEYENYINSFDESLKDFKDKQESYNYNQIVIDANKEIDDAIIELEEKREDGQKELDDAKKELQDALKEIQDGQKQIDDGLQELLDAQEEVDEGREELEKNEDIVKDAIKQVCSQYPSMSFDEIYLMTQNAYSQLIETKALVSDAYNLIISSCPEGLDFEIYFSYLSDEAKQAYETYMYVESQLQIVEPAFNNLKQLKQAQSDIEDGRQKLADAQWLIDKGYIEIEDAKNKLADGKRKYYDGLKEYEDGLKEFDEKIADGEKKIFEAKHDLENLEEPKWYILDRDSHYTSYMYKNTCSQMKAICIVMPILFFLVAGLVCMTTMTRLVDEQRGMNAIYTALGYSNAYVIGEYLLYVVIASLLGSIPGMFIGIFMFPTVIYETWRLLYILPEMILDIKTYIVVLVFFSFMLLMSSVTYFILKKSLKEKPAQLMRPKAPKSTRETFIENIKFIWNRLTFTSKITARNLIRYKSRFFMTVIGVAGCTGLLVLGWGIKDSIADVVNIQYGKIFNYSYDINLKNDDNVSKIRSELKNDYGIEEAIPYMNYVGKTTFANEEDDSLNVIVINTAYLDESFNLEDCNTSKSLKLPLDGVIISEKFSINNNLKVGDKILLESKEGSQKEVKISSICKMYFQHYLFIDESMYQVLFGEDVNYTSLAIETDKNLDDFNKIVDSYDSINSITDFTAFTIQFNNMIEALNLIILVIIITSGALAFVVLINLIQVNISERTREIATFKVLGFRDYEVNSYIFKEILILTIIGGLIGLPLGKIELKFVMNVINMEMIMFPTNIKLPSYIYAYILTMFFTVIVLIYSRKPIRKINMIESLKSVE